MIITKKRLSETFCAAESTKGNQVVFVSTLIVIRRFGCSVIKSFDKGHEWVHYYSTVQTPRSAPKESSVRVIADDCRTNDSVSMYSIKRSRSFLLFSVNCQDRKVVHLAH